MQFTQVAQNIELQKAIIVDIDGTIADKWERNPFDWTKVREDKPHTDIISLVKFLAEKYEIIFVSGRDEVCREDTQIWLDNQWLNWLLLMRKQWDKRSDDIVKYEILKELIQTHYIAYVLDDRNKVVKMWRDAGLRCLQVAEWNF